MASKIVAGRLGPKIYQVKLGGRTTTDDITREWRKENLFVNDQITQVNFPIFPHAPEDVEIEVIDPGCSFSEKEGLKFLASAGLGRPTYEHALRFAEQYGRKTTGEKINIIFLHKAWQDPGRDRRVVWVRRTPGDHWLLLHHSDRGFRGHYILAGVRPRKQVQA